MPTNCKKWSKEEEDFIRNNYCDMMDAEIGKILKRSIRSIKAKRERMGLFRYFQEKSSPIKGEVWKPIISSSGYEVSNKGRIKSKFGHLLSPHIHSKSGYVYISIDGKAKLVHVLVKEAFCGAKPSGMEIDHIDCNKTNNSLYNLEYVTHSENMKRAVSNGCWEHLFGR